MDESGIVDDWGPFRLVRSPDTERLTLLFIETRPDGTTSLRTASSLEKQRYLDHVIQEPPAQAPDDDPERLKVINWLRRELSQE